VIRQQKSTPEKWLVGTTRELRGRLVWSISLAFGSGLLIILQARLLALACQRLIIDHVPFSTIQPLVGWVVGLALLRGACTLLAERSLAMVVARVKTAVRSLLYRRLQLAGPAGRSGEETGPLVEAVTAGIEGLEPYLARFLPHAALAALLPPAMLLVVGPVAWRPALVLLFSAPFIPLFMVLIGRGSESLNQRQWQKLGWMAGHLLDLVQGLPDLRICSAVKRAAAAVARVSEEYRQSTMVVLRVAFLSAFTLEFFATVGTAVVAVIVGFQLLHGNLSLLDGLFVLLLAPEFYLPFRTLGLSYHARMQGLAAATTIVPLLELPRSVDGQSGALLLSPAAAPTIRFEQVCYRYGGDRGGVESIDLELPAGSITALVGESGSGKTTLARLLVGLAQPEAGRVLVNGADLASINGDDWRSRIAWVPQRPFFFRASVRNNLLLGCPNATDAEIHAALEAAAAAPFVAGMAAGLDTLLGDRGAGLSGGELRRLALARALLRRSTLVVMDEPTAGLDPANELLVTVAMQRLAVNRTLLVISHRETTVRCADRVVVMAAGQIVQQLTSEQFLATEAVWAH
jgi:ATP-binding cassette subfamily C protein CydD